MPFLRELLSFGKVLFAVLILRVFEVGFSTVVNLFVLLESRDGLEDTKKHPKSDNPFLFFVVGGT